MLFGHFLLNRLRLLFSDFRFPVVMIVVPLLLSLMTGNALDRQQRDEMTVLTVDLDGSKDSQALCSALKAKKGLSAASSDLESAMRRVGDNQVEAVLIIPPGYGERMRAGDSEDLLRLETAASADSRNTSPATSSVRNP